MPLGIWVILALEKNISAKIFNRGGWLFHGFLPCVQGFHGIFELLGRNLCLHQPLPGPGFIRSDRKDSPAQLDDRSFILRFLRLRKLCVQARKIAACSAQWIRRAQDQQTEYEYSGQDAPS